MYNIFKYLLSKATLFTHKTIIIRATITASKSSPGSKLYKNVLIFLFFLIAFLANFFVSKQYVTTFGQSINECFCCVLKFCM